MHVGGIQRRLEGLGRALVEGIRDQMESISDTFRKEPQTEESALRKCLKLNEQQFGKGSFYCLGSLMRLAEFYRGKYDGIHAMEYYDRAVSALEPELVARPGPELDRVVAAGLGKEAFPDAASVLERRADFLVLYAQPSRAADDLRRALELVSSPERRIQLLGELAELAGPEEALACRREIWELSLRRWKPDSPELAGPARGLAALVPDAGAYYALALCLEVRSRLQHDELASLYARIGQPEIACDLREQATVARLEESVRGAPCTPMLKRDLEQLVALYQKRGEEGAAVRTRHRLATVTERLGARSPGARR